MWDECKTIENLYSKLNQNCYCMTGNVEEIKVSIAIVNVHFKQGKAHSDMINKHISDDCNK